MTSFLVFRLRRAAKQHAWFPQSDDGNNSETDCWAPILKVEANLQPTLSCYASMRATFYSTTTGGGSSIVVLVHLLVGILALLPLYYY